MEQLENLTERKVSIVLVDPWELVTVNGPGPFLADVEAEDHESDGHLRLLLKLQRSLTHKGAEYSYLVVSPRHKGEDMRQLLSRIRVGCNLTGVSAEQAEGSNPFDLSSWRGGLAGIAEISLAR